MLRRKAVVNGDDMSGEGGGESAANDVEWEGCRSAHGEATAMEEDEDGEERSGSDGGRKETKPEIASGRNCDVRGGNGVDQTVGNGGELKIEETEKTRV